MTRAVLWTVALMLVACVAADAAVLTVTTVGSTSTPGDYGWLQASVGGAKGGITAYPVSARGNLGPAPMRIYYLQAGQDGGGSGTPGSRWVGTNRYSGVKLSDIQALNYWALVDLRGDENSGLVGPPDENGNRAVVPQEFDPKWYTSQPPGFVLFTTKAPGDPNLRMLIYRGWTWGMAGMISAGPRDGNQCRKWRYYDALSSGIWYVPEGVTKFTSFYDIAFNQFPDSVLTAPPVGSNPAGDWRQAPTGASFNLEFGAMKLSNPDFNFSGVGGPDYGAWWMESWNGLAIADMITMGYDSGTGYVEETFDFGGATKPLWKTALNCAALYPSRYEFKNFKGTAGDPDSSVWYSHYGPEPKCRAPFKPGEYQWWAGNDVTTLISPFTDPVSLHTLAEQAKQTALQRNTQYGRGVYVLYGKVVDKTNDGAPADPDGTYFYVTDGSSRIDTNGALVPAYVKCYVGSTANYFLPLRGQWLRMVGAAYVPNIWDWRWNNFHMRTKGDPTADPPTEDTFWKPFEVEFHSFEWDVTRLDQ